MPRVCTLTRSTVFKTYPCYHFSPPQRDRWYVIALHTGSPLSENNKEDDQRFYQNKVGLYKILRSKTCLCKREVFTANFFL